SVHERGELLRIVDGLRLKKLRTGFDLHLKFGQHRSHEVGFRRDARPDGKVRSSVELVSRVVPTMIQSLYEAHNLNGLEVVDGFRIFVVANRWVVAGETKNIANPKHVGAHQI